ncbi:MAG: hypothetical protein H6732_17875 [Alphaproteobacteria bacterium]|nr:hypothetical protein [Alphaproteobacteria bacterium]
MTSGRAAAVALLLAVAGEAIAAPFDGAPEGLVERVEATPFQQRFLVDGVDVRLVKAPGPDEPPRPARCRGGGVEMQVDGRPSEAAEAVIARACARLEVDAPALYSEVHGDLPDRPDPRARTALRLVAAAWVLLLLLGLPRTPAPWLWALLGQAVRVILAPPRILMGEAYPYDRLLTWLGLREPNLRYGLGSSALADVLRPLFGQVPDALHAADLVLSALVIPCAWGAALGFTGDRRTAHAAAALAALLPLPVALAGTESMFVMCSLLLAAGLLGLARGDRGLLAAVSAGLLAHTRPLQVGMALVIVVTLALRRRWVAGLMGLTLVAWRLVQIAGLPGDRPVPGGDDLRRLALHLVGDGSPTVVLDPFVTPWWLVPLALLGAWTGWRAGHRGAVLLLAATAAAGTVPYLPFHRATDQLRFHLPVHTAWALLAALAAPTLLALSPARRAAVAVALLSGLVLARQPLGGPMVHAVEHATARELLCALPPDTEVAYDPANDLHGGRARWMGLACDVRMLPTPEDGELPDGALVWRGQADRMEGARPPGRCAREPVDLRTTPSWTGRLIDLGPDDVVIGLERVRCAAPAAEP